MSTKQIIRIGTRDSELALWQANTVKTQLEQYGHNAVLVPLKSVGDIELSQPLYEMGITGIFTKTLDIAMISKKIDVAVHSMKDVPTALPKGIIQTAVLKRADSQDILIHKGTDFLSKDGIIATGSLRRKAQWLHRYPTHKVENLRGNVNTRLKKLETSNWDGAIFAAAGLERINLLPENTLYLDWMIPAPAQGAMLVVANEDNPHAIEATQKLNHQPTALCVGIERDFLRRLEGGCTAPIGALARIEGDYLHFKGALFSIDGTQKIELEKRISIKEASGKGEVWAKELLNNGGCDIMREIIKTLS